MLKVNFIVENVFILSAVKNSANKKKGGGQEHKSRKYQ
jgi:hypothetical protein